MRSKRLSTNNRSIFSPISTLYKKPAATVEKLNGAGIHTIDDLIWVFPKKVQKLPPVCEFKYAQVDSYFRGNGKIISVRSKPNFKAKGKGKALLYNINVIVKDLNSEKTMSLKWFNCYSSIQKKLEKLELITFLGVVSQFNGELQIANPDYEEIKENHDNNIIKLKVQYPTYASVSSSNISRTINKIPESIWNEIEEFLPEHIIEKHQFISRSEAFKLIHGRVDASMWNKEQYNQAIERLVYEEFFIDQIKIDLRKSKRKVLHGLQISISDKTRELARNLYPYELTQDQKSALDDIEADLSSGAPMMRLIQGDVGSGKTSVAVLACYYAIRAGFQAAIMCPTESLALQHYKEISRLFDKEYCTSLLIGSQSQAQRKEVLDGLECGNIKMVIGTHTLFQKNVTFKKLAISIIDEQHKFGVEQRLNLVNKGQGSHCLIMSATPIPRSLSLTQYGDLDISIIKSMPKGRKGTKTRIVTQATFDKFLSFIKTRTELGEQAYILVPAINESPDQNFRDIENTLKRFQAFFPELRIRPLHGQMKPAEKEKVFLEFKDHQIDILVATSVIEVGINITNATIMAILNPERFGLSSLHQMRGRVGRGEKPGFCFLVLDRALSPESTHRLQVIEKHHDGFKIAEEDLKIRGQGDLFGQEQSGVVTQKKLANIIEHQNILYDVISDFKSSKLSREQIENIISKFESDQKIYTTI